MIRESGEPVGRDAVLEPIEMVRRVSPLIQRNDVKSPNRTRSPTILANRRQ